MQYLGYILRKEVFKTERSHRIIITLGLLFLVARCWHHNPFKQGKTPLGSTFETNLVN
jgi:hypothetical protein